MNRIGLDGDDPVLCERIIRQYRDVFEITGIFTHLCVADTDTIEFNAFTDTQIMKFEAVVQRIQDMNLPYCHCLNTAGGLWHRSDVSCFARLGISLYGLKPDYMNCLPMGIQPAMTWKSVVSMVKTVSPGESIGYGCSFIAQKEMRIATIPTGYADGYSRFLSNKGYVLINGECAPIVGRVCMDQFMVDVSTIPNVEMGTEVVLLGKSGNVSIDADEMANMIGTIGYEVVCNISKRVPRVYCDGEK